MPTFINKRLYDWSAPGSAGVVTDTHFIRCSWPKLDVPTAIFAEGSSGIVVQGPPTPRNIIFPPDTQFPEILLDAERAAWAVYLQTQSADAYLAKYAEEVAKAPSHATKIAARDDVLFLKVHDKGDAFVAEVSKTEAAKVANGETTKEALQTTKDFVSVKDGKVYTVSANGTATTKGGK
jgi:hypothetical protein